MNSQLTKLQTRIIKVQRCWVSLERKVGVAVNKFKEFIRHLIRRLAYEAGLSQSNSSEATSKSSGSDGQEDLQISPHPVKSSNSSGSYGPENRQVVFLHTANSSKCIVFTKTGDLKSVSYSSPQTRFWQTLEDSFVDEVCAVMSTSIV